jgi:hypothetical protein
MDIIKAATRVGIVKGPIEIFSPAVPPSFLLSLKIIVAVSADTTKATEKDSAVLSNGKAKKARMNTSVETIKAGAASIK